MAFPHQRGALWSGVLALLCAITWPAHARAQCAATPAGDTGAASAPASSQAAAPLEPPQVPHSVTRPTITGDADTVARVDNQPLDPGLAGFFLLPGTETRLRVGGFARVDFIHDFQPIGSTDDFIVSTIPVDVVSEADNTTIHARETRVNLELRRPSRLGNLRILLENDFFGSNGERAFNLRHAFGQVANVLVGFTVSTLQDVDARPDTLDYEGPPGRLSARQAQIRYTLPMPGGQTVAFAAEEPKPNIPSDVGDDPVTARTPWPDAIVRYRLERRQGHLQVGSVLRSLGGYVGTGIADAQVFGAGLSVSGSWATNQGNILLGQMASGHGLARYIKDTSGLGLDLAIDDDGDVGAVGLVAGVAAYQRVWNTRVRSTLSASMVRIDRLAAMPGDTYRSSRYLSGNVMYTDGPFTIGLEYDAARLEVQDGRRNRAHRIQAAIQYDFIK
jgi:hypothetical protein